ncbi:cytochrome P450 (plasmid) [Streptosporangium sp. NBC_01495]|uniref:hypothetical protein n=1 Tax=Streptosporangium sp. NBC_01495 TaxID=2903899 RepID=UPI002E36BAA2|nr:hypothetical protein [Streptosporangium sp. NBC_01495]
MWLAEGVLAYAVVDLQTIFAINRAPDIWSRDSRWWPLLSQGAIPDDFELGPMMSWRKNLLFADGADHARLRAAVEEALADVNEDALIRQVQQEATGLIHAFASHGRADLVSQYAALVPLRIVMRLFGLDAADVNMLLPILQRIWDGTDAVAANFAYERILRRLIHRQRVWPGKTITAFLDAHSADLTEAELLQHLVLLIGAAGGPTGNLIANALGLLLCDGPLGRDVQAKRTTITEAIHQVLWRENPMQLYPFVFPVIDVTLGRHTIPAGTPVGMAITAANMGVTDDRDGQLHGNRAHASFGAGPHRCPGRTMALDIAAHAITQLFDLLPDLRLEKPGTPLTRRPSLFAYAVESLPVVFTAPSPSRAQKGSSWTPPAPSFSPQNHPTSKQPASTPSARRSRWNSLAAWLRGR